MLFRSGSSQRSTEIVIKTTNDRQRIGFGSDIPAGSRGLENPTSRKGESQWKISLERILTTTFAVYQNRFLARLKINKNLLKTNGDDFSGNILPDPKSGGAGGGLKGLLS